MDKFPRILRRPRFWAILMLAVILMVAFLWVEGWAPLYQWLGIARSVQIPVCACIGLNDPGDGSPPDEVVDLDPSMDDYNKFGWILKKPDQSRLLVRYSTQEQLYRFLKARGTDLCLATNTRLPCASGHVVLLTEDVNGEVRSIDYGGPPCELATPKPFEWATPDVKVNSCFGQAGCGKDATCTPAPPPSDP